jgi:hypothetical protein
VGRFGIYPLRLWSNKVSGGVPGVEMAGGFRLNPEDAAEFIAELVGEFPAECREALIRQAAKEAGLTLLNREQSDALDAYRQAVARHPMDTRDERTALLEALLEEVDDGG